MVQVLAYRFQVLGHAVPVLLHRGKGSRVTYARADENGSLVVRAQVVNCLCACDELRRAALAAVPVHTGTGWRKPGRASGLLTPSPMQHVERLEPPVAARKRRRRAIGFAGPGCTGCSLCSDAGFHVLRHWERLPRIAFSPEAKGAVDFSTAPFAQVFSVALLPQRFRAVAPKR